MPDDPPKTPEALETKDFAKAYDPQQIEPRWAQAWVEQQLFRPASTPGGKSLLHRYSAAQCDWIDSHRAHAGAHADRHADALAPHARLPNALAAGHGPRGNRHASGRRARIGQGRAEAQGDRTRGVRAARLGVEGAFRRQHQAANDPSGRLMRLVARAIHARSAALSRGARSFSAPLPRGIDLSRSLHRELVSALHDGAERSRGGSPGAQRASLAYSLPRRGVGPVARRRYDAARNDAGRYRSRGSSAGRTLPWLDRPESPAAAGESGNSHHRRRVRGSRIRHRRRQGNPGA